jgi:hypothetical protein
MLDLCLSWRHGVHSLLSLPAVFGTACEPRRYAFLGVRTVATLRLGLYLRRGAGQRPSQPSDKPESHLALDAATAAE